MNDLEQNENNDMSAPDMILMALKKYGLAAYVYYGIHQGKLKYEDFMRNLTIEGYRFSPLWTQKDLPGVAENLYRAAFSVCAMTLDQAMEKAFGKASDTDLKPSNDLDSARAIAYSLRCTFAHGITDPNWKLLGKRYQKVWQIKKIEYIVDLTSVYGKDLKMKHYGNWIGFMKLLSYCYRQVQKKTGDYSKTLEFNLGTTKMKTCVISMVKSSYIKDRFIFVPKAEWDLFPSITTELELETDIATIKTRFFVGNYRGFSRNLKSWFEAHPNLQAGDTLCITMTERGKKYRLELLLKN